MVIKMKEKNTKHNFILFGVIVLVILLGAFFVYKLAFSDGTFTHLEDVSLSQLDTKITNKESFVLVITQTGCSHCEQYLPELNKTLEEYDLKANVLNITNLSEEDSKKLSSYVNFSGTPTTIFFIDGEEKTTLNRLVGYASRDKIIERLKSLGYIG